jgi:hypothetical protein
MRPNNHDLIALGEKPMTHILIEFGGLTVILVSILWFQSRLPADRKRRARKQALAGTVVLSAILGLSWACSEGDPEVRAIDPFDLYANYMAVENHRFGYGGNDPLGRFPAGGDVYRQQLEPRSFAAARLDLDLFQGWVANF